MDPFFAAIHPAEYRITVQCLQDTQAMYTIDEKCLGRSVRLCLHICVSHCVSKNLTPRWMLKRSFLIATIKRWNNSFQDMYDML